MTNGGQVIGCEIATFHSGKRKDGASCPNYGYIVTVMKKIYVQTP